MRGQPALLRGAPNSTFIDAALALDELIERQNLICTLPRNA
jgi:hypothetical protein